MIDHLGKRFEVETSLIEYWAELGYIDGGGVGKWEETYYSSGPYADRRDAIDDLLRHPDVGKHPWRNFEGTGMGNTTNYGDLRVRSNYVII